MTDQPPGSYPPPGSPPSGGGYTPPPQPPQGGGYTPPPQPPQGGGYTPPPPQSGGYPPAGGFPPAGAPGYGGQQPYSVGDAFSWAWNKFSKNAVALIVPALVYAVIVGVLGVIVWGLAYALAPNPVTTYESYDGGFEYSTSSGLGAASIVVLILGYLVLLVVGAAIQSAFISGLLDIANGREVTIGSFFKPRNIGNVIVAGLIIAVLTGIGYLLCVIPGLAVALFSMFAIVALLDRNLSPIDAIKTSFEIVRNNFGSALLTWLVMTAIVFAGALVCYVGLLVALPVAGLFLVYTYRSLIGGQVAPLTP